MGTLAVLLWIAAGLCGLTGFVFFIVILVHAFKVDTAQGFLCLCVPLYVLYFAFAKFEHPKKAVIIGVWLGTYALQGFLYWGAAFATIKAGTQALEQYSVPAAQPGAYPQAPGAFPATPLQPGATPSVIPMAPPTTPTLTPVPPPGTVPGQPPASPMIPIGP